MSHDENISQKKRGRKKKETTLPPQNIQLVMEETASCDGGAGGLTPSASIESFHAISEEPMYENTYSTVPEEVDTMQKMDEFVMADRLSDVQPSQPAYSAAFVATEVEPNSTTKKRGRKSKGGKLIHKSAINSTSSTMNTNIILHLKCSLKDIQGYDEYDYIQDPLKYNPTIPPEIMMYNDKDTQFSSYNEESQLLASQMQGQGSVWKPDHRFAYKENICSKCYGCLSAVSTSKTGAVAGACAGTSDSSVSIGSTEATTAALLTPVDSTTTTFVPGGAVGADDEPVDIKDVNAKLKQLRIQLYKNEMHEKKSACFWCTYDFDNPPCYILKYEMDGTICGYGSFCRPECGVGFLMKENIDDSTKFERYQLMNQIYGKVYAYKKNIKPAPNPYYLLDKYYGNLSIQQYRKLLKTEHMLLVIDKPLTRILPELHDDNDEFILNIYGGGDTKMTQGGQTGGGVYKVKRQSEKKQGPTKNSIIRDKFGLHP